MTSNDMAPDLPSIRNWSDHQVLLLVEGIQIGVAIDTLASRIGKGPDAVRRARLKIKDHIHKALYEDMPKRGALWTVEEQESLRQSFESGSDLPAVISHAGRTAGGILGQLVRMELVVLVGDTYHRVGANGKPARSLGYTWSDHVRLEMMAYGYELPDIPAETNQEAQRPRATC